MLNSFEKNKSTNSTNPTNPTNWLRLEIECPLHNTRCHNLVCFFSTFLDDKKQVLCFSNQRCSSMVGSNWLLIDGFQILKQDTRILKSQELPVQAMWCIKGTSHFNYQKWWPWNSKFCGRIHVTANGLGEFSLVLVVQHFSDHPPILHSFGLLVYKLVAWLVAGLQLLTCLDGLDGQRKHPIKLP